MNKTVTDKFVNILIALLFGLTIVVLLIAILGGFYLAPPGVTSYVEYDAYFQKHNWWPFPLFAVLVWFLVRTSWDGFLDAWKESKEIIRTKKGSPITDESLVAIVRDMASFRKFLVVAAICSSIIYNAIDARHLWSVYTTQSAAVQIFTAVNEEPDWFTHFVFDSDSASGYERTKLAVQAQSLDELSMESQNVFRPGVVQLLITVLGYSQELLLVAMAFLVLYQLIAQMLFFAFVDRLPNGKRASVEVWLHYKDEFKEFGLRRFNNALNRTYWWISACLPMALISKIEQAELSSVHFIGNALVACIPIAPLFLTVISRQYWTEPCKQRAAQDLPNGPKEFNEQRIWPMTTNNLHAAGIGAAIFLTCVLVGFDVFGLVQHIFTR